MSISVRGYETDSQGHLNQAVYLQYADLENTIRYYSELRAGDKVEVTCAFIWGERKTFRIEQLIRRTDGTSAAELRSVGGLLDLGERQMMADPREYFRALADDPAVIGL